ncbi:hypothetical protein NFI96_017035, partial [Prochilodus magdalenae]
RDEDTGLMFCRNPCTSTHTPSLPHPESTEPAAEQHPERGGTEQRDRPAGRSQTEGGAGFSSCLYAGEQPIPPPRRRRSTAKHHPPNSGKTPAACSESHRPRDHPWMELIQPGPWAKLPPAPPPAPPSHPPSIPSLSQLWFRRWSTPSNPFEEEKEEDEGLRHDERVKACTVRSGQSRSDARHPSDTNGGVDSLGPGLVSRSLNDSTLDGDVSVADVSRVAGFSTVANVAQACSCPAVSGLAENASLPSAPDLAPGPCDSAGTNLDSAVGLQPSSLKSNQDQQQGLPQHSRELASSNHKPWVTNSPTTPLLPANGLNTGCTLYQISSSEESSTSPSPSSSSSSPSSSSPSPIQTERSCTDKLFNRKAPPTDSLSQRRTTTPSSTLGRAPGHGVPLSKRKVEVDANVHVEEFQRQQGRMEKKQQELEQRGEELEKTIPCTGGDQQELLVDWSNIVPEKHMSVHRDAELVYRLKQQELEQKQAVVEFELRSLLNKPEQEWTEDDQVTEQRLTFELLAIIQQRDDIIISQEEDRQREQEEEGLLEDVTRRTESQRQVNPHLLSFAGKLKPLKVLKMLKGVKARGSNRKEKEGAPSVSPEEARSHAGIYT